MRHLKRTTSGRETPSIAQALQSTLWSGIDPVFAGVDEASMTRLHRATRYGVHSAGQYEGGQRTHLAISNSNPQLPETSIVLRQSAQEIPLANEARAISKSTRGLESVDSDRIFSSFDENPEELPHQNLVVESGNGARAGGAFADVYRGRLAGEPVAIKAIRRITEVSPEQMNRKFNREAQIWWGLKHVNVLPLLGFVTKPEFSPYKLLISPWCENGNLAEFMKKNPSMRPSLRIDLFCGVASGLLYLHSRTSIVIHGDLKPANILLDRNWAPKLCDFGLVRVIHEGPSSGHTPISNHLGTIRYTAPELLDAQTERQWWAFWMRSNSTQIIIRPTTSSDIYAMGCIGMEILTSTKPYGHIAGDGLNATLALLNEIKGGRPPARRPSTAHGVTGLIWREILEPTWKKKPSKRPTAKEVFTLLDAVRKDHEFS